MDKCVVLLYIIGVFCLFAADYAHLGPKYLLHTLRLGSCIICED